jgi:hypothetical protein
MTLIMGKTTNFTTCHKKSVPIYRDTLRTVRMEGLEPPYLAASDPKSDVSTNFTTCALFSFKFYVLSLWLSVF